MSNVKNLATDWHDRRSVRSNKPRNREGTPRVEANRDGYQLAQRVVIVGIQGEGIVDNGSKGDKALWMKREKHFIRY